MNKLTIDDNHIIKMYKFLFDKQCRWINLYSTDNMDEGSYIRRIL